MKRQFMWSTTILSALLMSGIVGIGVASSPSIEAATIPNSSTATTFASAPPVPWNQLNLNYGVVIYLTKQRWLHISNTHGLHNSQVLKDIVTGSDQWNRSSNGNHIWLGTTYYRDSYPHKWITVFIVIHKTDGQYDITTAYPLTKTQKPLDGITSHTNIDVPESGGKTQFPAWFDHPSQWHRTGDLVIHAESPTGSQGNNPAGSTYGVN